MSTLISTQLAANALLRSHGLADKGWRFVWDNARSRGGQCRHSSKQISMSRYLVPLWDDKQVMDTIMHELAHALVGPGAGHGPVWRAKMRELGQRPDRTHDNPVVAGRYQAVCAKCGPTGSRKHRMSPAMREGRHAHRVCGSRVSWVDTQGVRV